MDPIIVQVRPKTNSKSESNAVFIIYTSEYPVQGLFQLKSMELCKPLHVFDWIKNQAWPEAVEHFFVTLDALDGVILLLSENPFAAE